MKEKILVLYSGGLDSRLVAKLLKKTHNVSAIYFNLPFGCGCCNLNCSFNFTQKENINLKIVDISEGKLFEEYINILRNPKYPRGKGMNPCIDCKIFMFKKAKEYADEKNIKMIASGEVTGQRPMSQTNSKLKIIDKELGFEIKRPLVELGINGRTRVKQMELAKKFKINYPNPSGGCLLCEKQLKKRFEILLKKNLINSKNFMLVKTGKHFIIDDDWFVVGRNEKENILIETFSNSLKSKKETPAVYYLNSIQKALLLQKAYSKQTKNNKFEKWKI